jgi:hypothetical protein
MVLTLMGTRPAKSGPTAVTFSRAELNAILSLYGHQVTRGHWRDYALDFTRDMAAFSAFRKSGEQAFVAILKIPSNTKTGYVFEILLDKKRLSRSAFLDRALEDLRSSL